MGTHVLRLALLSGLFVLLLVAAFILLVFAPEAPMLQSTFIEDLSGDIPMTGNSEYEWSGNGEIPAIVYATSDSTIEFLKSDFYKRSQIFVVTVESAELFSKPGGGIVTEAVFFEPVNKIGEPKSGYIQVELPVQRGYRGFVRENQIAAVDCSAVRDIAIVRDLNVRAFRVESGEADVLLPPGSILPILGEAGDVVQFATPMGALWVNKNSVLYLRPGKAEDTESILRSARMFVGQPYKWGGLSFSHFDCSGFVQLVYRINGVLLKRDADIQFGDESALKIAEDSAGSCDLLFISTYKSAASHVGIITGDGKIIHASPQKGVVEDYIQNSTFSRHKVLGVRRFLPGDAP